MDKTDLNNDADAGSIEKKSDNASPKGITFKKNADGKVMYMSGVICRFPSEKKILTSLIFHDWRRSGSPVKTLNLSWQKCVYS